MSGRTSVTWASTTAFQGLCKQEEGSWKWQPGQVIKARHSDVEYWQLNYQLNTQHTSIHLKCMLSWTSACSKLWENGHTWMTGEADIMDSEPASEESCLEMGPASSSPPQSLYYSVTVDTAGLVLLLFHVFSAPLSGWPSPKGGISLSHPFSLLCNEVFPSTER